MPVLAYKQLPPENCVNPDSVCIEVHYLGAPVGLLVNTPEDHGPEDFTYFDNGFATGRKGRRLRGKCAPLDVLKADLENHIQHVHA